MFSPQNFKKQKLFLYLKLEITKNRNDYRQSHYCRFCLNFWKDIHVHRHLVTYLETRYLFHPLQSGFRRKHSCNTAPARLTDSWFSAINKSDLSGDVFLDLKKAFDLVDHRISLSKLSVYLNSSKSLPFSCSYLNNRVPYVFLRGYYSSEGTVKCGVPQGSVLGPVLFCIYINYLPLHTPSHSAKCHMLADNTTHQTTGKKHCANSEDAPALSWSYFSVVQH